MKPPPDLTFTQKAIANVPVPLALAAAVTLLLATAMGWPRCLLAGVPYFILLYAISWLRHNALLRRRRIEDGPTAPQADTND